MFVQLQALPAAGQPIGASLQAIGMRRASRRALSKRFEMEARKPGAGSAACGKAFERMFGADIACHPVMRRDVRHTIKAIAQIEIACGDDIGRHSIDLEGTEKPGVDPDTCRKHFIAARFEQR